MNYQAACITHRGLVRSSNEDAIYISGHLFAESSQEDIHEFSSNNDAYWLVAVADGLGGHNSGEVASRFCLESLSNISNPNRDNLIQTLHLANRNLYRLMLENPDQSGMGTTVAGMAYGSDGLLCFNVGDSRVYRFQDNFLNQLTKDDSTAQVLEDAGFVEHGESRPESMHFLTQSIGGRSQIVDIKPHVESVRIKSTSKFLICSDGLTDYTDLDALEDACEGKDLQGACKSLLAVAIERGGKDNISIITMKISCNNE